ncbi:hypothetical protein N7466_009485 [Penicillium verhagenii]|uniref:uncharacterized protein n=1 Tax=Penicillium verhagenii TaxID=1562060 RepID=UPI00254568EF|nr:uncharacterized protein N7466_009485 [Penicillium verhagenii]KAJ5921159.1 hypothetical protein N7466_009485 [Penicillium verhagenii]
MQSTVREPQSDRTFDANARKQPWSHVWLQAEGPPEPPLSGRIHASTSLRPCSISRHRLLVSGEDMLRT